MTQSSWNEVRRLLVARLDNAGDVVMAGPALRALRRSLASTSITLWASPGGADIAPLLPDVDETLVSRAIWQDLGHLNFDPSRERDLIQTLANGQYDAAIILTSFSQSPLPAAYACYLAGIPLRAGQTGEFAGAVLSHPIEPIDLAAHQVDRNLHIVRGLGFPADSTTLALGVPSSDQDTIGMTLRLRGIGLGRPFVVLHPGASCSARRYPAVRFAEVGRSIWSSLGWPSVVTGSDRDRDLAKDVTDRIGPGAISLAGETTVGELAALIERATGVITNNTVTMHIADAVRTPVVVLFAGTEREGQWRPRSSPSRLLRRPTTCSPCYRFECPIGLPCLDIPPSEVTGALHELVEAAIV